MGDAKNPDAENPDMYITVQLKRSINDGNPVYHLVAGNISNKGENDVNLIALTNAVEVNGSSPIDDIDKIIEEIHVTKANGGGRKRRRTPKARSYRRGSKSRSRKGRR